MNRAKKTWISLLAILALGFSVMPTALAETPVVQKEAISSGSEVPGKSPAQQKIQKSGSVQCRQGDPTVWVNEPTQIYHYNGSRWYGHTKHGHFSCESNAKAEGARVSHGG